MEIETLPPRDSARAPFSAIAERENRSDRSQNSPNRVRIGERAEIFGAVVFHTPHQHKPREALLPREFQIGVPFVVFEPDVVAGPMLLDESALENERFNLGIGRDIFDRIRNPHEGRRFGVERF